MCDNVYSILKDFVFRLPMNATSEQMYIEDKEDTDMYFTLRIEESDTNSGNIHFEPKDRSHGSFIVSLQKGSGIKRTLPIRIGTYGKTSESEGENTGLYVVFEILPFVSEGSVIYNAFVQYQVKGGE